MKTQLFTVRSIGMVLSGLVMCLSVSHAETPPHQKVDCYYSITMEGYKVGQARQSRRTGGQAGSSKLRIDETSQLQLNGSWGDWKLSTESVVEFSPDNILAFDHKVDENGKKYRIRGKLRNGELWCSANQVLTTQEKKDQEDEALLKGIGTSVLSEAIPHFDTAVEVVDFFGGDKEQGGEVRIPLKDFDATIRELPLYLQRHSYHLTTNKIRLLDTGTQEVQSYSIKMRGEEKISLGGRTFLCRVVFISSSTSEISYWIAEDEIGPFLVKESGKDDGDAYELLLTKYKKST